MDATRPRAPRHRKLPKGRRGGGRPARRCRRSAAAAPQRGRRSASLQHGRPPASPQRRRRRTATASPQRHRSRMAAASPQRHRGHTTTASPQRRRPSASPHHGRSPAFPQHRHRPSASPQYGGPSASPQHGGSFPTSPQYRHYPSASPQHRHHPTASPQHGGSFTASPQHQHRPSASPAGSSRPAQPRSSRPGAERAGRALGRWWRSRRGGMALSQQCEAAFGTADLYAVLGVRRGASAQDIRRGYHRASLRLHPDRVPAEQKEEATRRFQILGKVYAVLSDEQQRAVYDETGTVDEEAEALQDGRDWLEYWQLLFKVTVKDIEDFKSTYKNSEEELADVKAAYLNFKGDMDRIMESVLCVDYTDEPRIREMIERAIESGEVPSYKAFVKESKQKTVSRRKRAEKEAKEAKKTIDDLGLSGENDLQALIKRRGKDREKEMDNFFAHLEAKYGNSAKKGGKKTSAKKRKAEGTD